ncbi:hypothetical protein PGT21_010680 [Puccinia graminis f. sp. tritici]|uniref:Hydrophobin n=1 Tax=Puccinia graminis f. sp. tritici TaxID=56615 RepID=A0A5B0QT72_PUCGR|nr:hypothetical protein PGTUg99_024259 [Puccinia graminis f. sp. tritici]KAA1116360.1 hypothetical protein PGT21_010680 [Puccinia graminis f. sp. tritici]
MYLFSLLPPSTQFPPILNSNLISSFYKVESAMQSAKFSPVFTTILLLCAVASVASFGCSFGSPCCVEFTNSSQRTLRLAEQVSPEPKIYSCSGQPMSQDTRCCDAQYLPPQNPDGSRTVDISTYNSHCKPAGPNPPPSTSSA